MLIGNTRSSSAGMKSPFISRWLAHEATSWKQGENAVETRLDSCCPCPQPSTVCCLSLSARVAVWLSCSDWMNPRRSEMWAVLRFGWFNVEMERPADANWADISAGSTSLLKNHVLIGLRARRFKALSGFRKKKKTVCVLLLPLSLLCSHSCCRSYFCFSLLFHIPAAHPLNKLARRTCSGSIYVALMFQCCCYFRPDPLQHWKVTLVEDKMESITSCLGTTWSKKKIQSKNSGVSLEFLVTRGELEVNCTSHYICQLHFRITCSNLKWLIAFINIDTSR